jgi:DNA-binding FadR family transcriptional regulator
MRGHFLTCFLFSLLLAGRLSSSSPPTDAAQRQRERLLRPVGAPKSLSSEAVDRLAEQIMSGKLPVGAKLPSEAETMKGMGVSRGRIVKEHGAIFQAIAAHSPKRARDAMRGHLLKTRERYRELASGKSAT